MKVVTVVVVLSVTLPSAFFLISVSVLVSVTWAVKGRRQPRVMALKVDIISFISVFLGVG